MLKWTIGLLALGLVSLSSLADTPPPWAVKIKGSDGTLIDQVGGALKVSGTSSVSGNVTVVQPTGTNLHSVIDNFPSTQAVTGTFFQATQPVSGSLGRTWSLLNTTDSVNVGNFPATQPISAVSLPLPAGAATAAGLTTINTTLGAPFQAGGSIGNSSFGISGTLPSYAATPTFNLGTLNGAATSAAQATGNTSLSSIDGKTPSLGQALAAGSAPVVLTASQLSTLTPLSTVAVTGTFFQSTQPVSATSLPLPTGAATSALQTTINTTLGSPLQSGGSIGNTSFGISGTLPAFAATPTFNIGTTGGLALDSTVSKDASLTTLNTSVNTLLKPASTLAAVTTLGTITNALPAGTNSIGTVVQTALATGSISNNAAITTAASTFTAPANAIGFILEAESGNTDNIRWAVGSTATSSVGMLAEPGRDSGYIPIAANISVIAISGTQSASVQWVVR
jgi:hypothetical protein